MVPTSVQSGLALFPRVPVQEFKLPLTKVLAANSDILTRAALEAALERGEELAVDSLLQLLGSSNRDVVRLATQNLGQSGKPTDVLRIETRIDQLLKTTQLSRGQVPLADNASSVVDELRLAIRKYGCANRLQRQALQRLVPI